MSKIKVDIEEFFSLVPLFILTAIKDDDLLDDIASEYFDDISKKVLAPSRQYFRQVDPMLRQKFKILLKGLGNNQNGVITITGDDTTTIKESGTEQKYLTGSWKPMKETIQKYL